jgi:hypothetical protein
MILYLLFIRQDTSGVAMQSFHQTAFTAHSDTSRLKDLPKLSLIDIVEALVNRSQSKLSLIEHTTNGYYRLAGY